MAKQGRVIQEAEQVAIFQCLTNIRAAYLNMLKRQQGPGGQDTKETSEADE